MIWEIVGLVFVEMILVKVKYAGNLELHTDNVLLLCWTMQISWWIRMKRRIAEKRK